MNVLYEDNHILVAVKPQNIPTQADSSQDADFLGALKDYIKQKHNKPGAVYLGLVHRLDRPTGGVMVFARTSKAAARLSAQLKSHAMRKVYLAIVRGSLAPQGTLENHLLKDTSTNTSRVVSANTPGAKHARLRYRTLASQNGNHLLEIELETGRSHQIRVQCAHIGAPIIGDKRYGGSAHDSLCLWCHSLTLQHPTKQELMTFTCPPPAYFARLVSLPERISHDFFN